MQMHSKMKVKEVIKGKGEMKKGPTKTEAANGNIEVYAKVDGREMEVMLCGVQTQ
jgi:hypothetical protein